MAEKAAAAEEPRGDLQSPLTLTVAAVVVVVGYVLMSTGGEAVVGAAAGAAAGVCILKSLWEEEERKKTVAVVVTAVAGGVAGAAAAKLQSIVFANSLTGSAIVGAIAGAAIVAIARKQLQLVIQTIEWLIVILKTSVVITLMTMGGILLNAIMWVADKIKWAVATVKSAVQWIKEAVKTLFNRLSSMTGSALAEIAAIGISVVGLVSGLFGGLLGLALVLAVGAAVFGSHRIGQSQGLSQGQSQATDMVLPIGIFLLFVLICFLVTSVGVWQFCGLLFLSLFLWFLLRHRSDKN